MQTCNYELIYAGEGFADILKKKEWQIRKFQTVYSKVLSVPEKHVMMTNDPKTRKDFKNGSGGGAPYVLEKKGYLPIEMSIKDSTFENNYSEYLEPEQRADLIIIDCQSVSVANETISKHIKNKYQLYAAGCKLKDVSNRKYLKCENKNAN